MEIDPRLEVKEHRRSPPMLKLNNGCGEDGHGRVYMEGSCYQEEIQIKYPESDS